MSQRRRAVLTQGPIAPMLAQLTFFMMVGIVGMMAFNLIDTFFVGQLGKLELAAMSFTFPVVMVLNSLALGLGIGASSVISRAIGGGNDDEVKRLTTDSLFLSVTIVGVFVLSGYLTIGPLFRALGASEELLPLIDQYMSIWYAGVPFVVIPMVGNNAIRATGDTKTPSQIMLVAIAVNTILDPLFIFGLGPFPEMRLEGAAVATVIARAVTFLFSLAVLYRRERMITLAVPGGKALLLSWKKIMYVGVPDAATRLVMPITIGIVTRMIAVYGVGAVAAFGVASRVEIFTMSFVMALSSVIIPFVGQNRGARKPHRIATGLKYSYAFSLAWGGFAFLVFLLLSHQIAALFNKDPEIVRLTSLYLKIVSASFAWFGFLMISGSAFNALNKPLNSASLSIVRMFILYLPLAWISSLFYGITGIFAAAAAANFLSGAIGIIWIRKTMTSLNKHQNP